MWKGKKKKKWRRRRRRIRSDPAWKEKKKKKKKKKKKTKPDLTTLWLWVPQICVYLPKCHYNSISITQIYLKVVFSVHNSSLKNQRIEWWKQKLKKKSKQTKQPWDPLVLSYRSWKQSDWWWKTLNPNSPLILLYYSTNLRYN